MSEFEALYNPYGVDDGSSRIFTKIQNYYANIGIASCSLLILIGLMWLAKSVYSLVGFHDKGMMGMVIFLNLEVAFQIAFYVMNAMSYLDKYRIAPNYTEINDDFASKLAGIAYPSTICLATAVILNCKNWYYYYSKIGVMAYRADPYDKEKQMMFKGHRKNMRCINFVTIFAVIVNIAILVTVCEFSFSGRRNMNSAQFFEIYTLALFGLLSIAFAITSFLLIRRLRRFYPDFFQ